SRRSLSAGGQGASSACACGVSLDALFPQESRTPAQLTMFEVIGKPPFVFIKETGLPSYAGFWKCHDESNLPFFIIKVIKHQ
ncbi:hypothetical protein ACQKMY_09485, partial [Peribacillus frigoritolerans]|uniref:hypothetical protein n=1 Tax=Peribacillus frigoritolerans TaxID=450367 RepID=UPI003D0337D7